MEPGAPGARDRLRERVRAAARLAGRVGGGDARRPRRQVGHVRTRRPLPVRRPAPPAAPRPGAPADHDRRQRREEDPADGGPLRRHVERDGSGRRDGPQDRRAAPALRRGRARHRARSSSRSGSRSRSATPRAEADRVWQAAMAHNRTPLADVADDDTFWNGTSEQLAERLRPVRQAGLPDRHLGAARAVRRGERSSGSSARSSRWSTPPAGPPPAGAARWRIRSLAPRRTSRRVRRPCPTSPAPPRPSSSARHQALRPGREGHAGRRQRPVADRAGGPDLRPRRAVGLRQDDQPQDGQPADRADLRPDPDRRRRHRDARRHRAAPLRSATSSSRSGLFPHQTIGENVVTVPRLLGWPKARRRERADELLELVGLDPARYRDRYPRSSSAASGSASASRGRWPPTRRSC